ncbi:hypothetical protein EI94DRAFT_1687838 [Lactarius quietus]|nr:hypothetical protein EI94DRAFT_1687838 [Lactarius quietus]
MLSCLLTFIFPVPSVIPSSLEEKMELLSVAQKYEMTSVIDHIRGSLSMQDPPFIHRENAFLAYSLAQGYELRREAIQAARITLKFKLTIEKFVNVMPGAYLHELWKYHQRVQAGLKSELTFRFSGVGSSLSAFKCSHHSFTSPSHWVNSYIRSITESPSLFDPIEFQMASMRHVTSTLIVNNVVQTANVCALCTQIPAETLRTFWTTLAAIIHRHMEWAESGLRILGTEIIPRINIGSPALSFPLPDCLDTSEADVVLRSSDNANFLVHKAILSSSSPVFRDIFSLPQSPNSGTVDGLPVVDISEDAELVRSLVTFLYPIPSEIPASYGRILALLASAQKYDMDAVLSSIRGEISRRQLPKLDGTQAFRAYAIASNFRLIPEMNVAAPLTLCYPMTFEHLEGDLRLFQRWALHELANYRKSCRDHLVTCFQSFLDPLNSLSKSWDGCPGIRAQPMTKDAPTLPMWLHSIFSQQIEDLKQDFTRPLISSSIIRGKYLEALRSHAAGSGACAFCLKIHTLKGEDYCVQLEQAITDAREKPSVACRE